MLSGPAKSDVTILMPCLNEASTLPYSIHSAQSALEQLKGLGLSGEILVADNGSSDGSRDIALGMSCRVVDCRKKGYGSALICGVADARGGYIVMGDADGSYDFAEAVPMVLKLKEGYDLCMGSRFKGRIMPGAMPWKNRYLGNPFLTGLLNAFFSSGFSDAHCGLRAFTKDAFDKMRLESPGMEFASEMVVKASILKLKRAEVPVTLYPDKRNRPPHLKPWEDGKRHIKFLLIYGPLRLFFVPSIIMMLFGSLIFTGLLFTPPHQVFRFWHLQVGDHWLILAGGMFSIGFQGCILGMIALLYRILEDSVPTSLLLRKIFWKVFSMQNAVFFGAAVLLASFGMFGYIVWEWSKVHFGELYRIREMVIATTLLVVGMQTLFGVLLAAVVAGELKQE